MRNSHACFYGFSMINVVITRRDCFVSIGLVSGNVSEVKKREWFSILENVLGLRVEHRTGDYQVCRCSVTSSWYIIQNGHPEKSFDINIMRKRF